MELDRNRWWFVFYEHNIILQKSEDGKLDIPFKAQLEFNQPNPDAIHEYCFHDKYPCTAVKLSTAPVIDSARYTMLSLRDSFFHLDLWKYQAAGSAQQLIYWDENTRFCPACGTATERKSLIMKKCPKCEKEQYPPIQTAVIVLIRKGDEILLAHAHNFKYEFYGLIAGYVEIAETLEESVRREVKEETGLNIRNIQYFGNQPWPYPSGLMVGFIADYESGEICIQEEELRNAAFFSKDNLPALPQKLSIARRMIDWWLDQQIKKEQDK